MSRSTKLSRFGALVAAAALALAAVAVPAAPAFAHDNLIGSDPAAGAVLDAAPEQIVLDYSGNIMTLGDSSTLVVVMDADGRDWVDSAPVVDGGRVTVPLSEGMPGGAYEVSWQVVSEDGHPRSDVFSFTVDAPAAPIEEPADEEPTNAPSAEPEVEDEADDTADEGGLSAGVIAAIVVIAAGVVAVIILVVRRRGRSTDA